MQKNIFMENLLEFRTALQVRSDTIICDMCNIMNEGKAGEIPKATTRCLECKDNYCESCAKVHRFQKVSKDHQMVNIGSDKESERNRLISMKSCTTHTRKLLNYYCAECKKIVCVSCFAEGHKFHNCKEVTTVDEEFRKLLNYYCAECKKIVCVSCFAEGHKFHNCKEVTTVDEEFRLRIEQKELKISTYVNEMLIERNNNEKRKADFLTEIAVTEKEIFKRSLELKDMIDRHTQSLLDKLSVLKSKELKEMEMRLEEIDKSCLILRSFEAYCTELRLKGSASDICGSVDQLIVRADELERDQETFFECPHQCTKVTFQARDL